MDGWNTIPSFWDGLFSGAMLVLGSVLFLSSAHVLSFQPLVQRASQILYFELFFGTDRPQKYGFIDGQHMTYAEKAAETRTTIHFLGGFCPSGFQDVSDFSHTK